MRTFFALWVALGGCSTPTMREEPDDPAVLRRMLSNADPLRREEAAQRLLRLGVLVDEAADLSFLGRALEERDPQRMVWRAWHAVRVGCLGREWSRVESALQLQGFQLKERYEPDVRWNSKYERYVAKPAAYVNGAGDKHDLFFWVHAVRRGEPWVVREVYVGLHVTFDAPFKELAERERYPRGSVPARFFGLSEVKKLAAAFPILEEMELTYGRIRDKDAETDPAGFHLNAGFATAAEGKAGGRGIYYTVESGLDPRETKTGRLVWEGFTSSDALGPLAPRGSSVWGAGGLKPSGD